MINIDYKRHLLNPYSFAGYKLTTPAFAKVVNYL